MTTSPIDSLIQLSQLAASFDSSKLDDVYSSVAQRISASAASDITEAVSELVSLGIDPDKYIAVPRSYQRQQRANARIEQERQLHAQQLRHAEELHQQQVRRLNAATEMAEASSTAHTKRLEPTS